MPCFDWEFDGYNAIVTNPSVEEFDFGLMFLFGNQNSRGSSDDIPQQGYMQGESGIADQVIGLIRQKTRYHPFIL